MLYVYAEGHRIQLKRNSVRNLEELISPGGRTIEFKYDSADRMVEARDDRGRVHRGRSSPSRTESSLARSDRTLEFCVPYRGFIF